MNDLVSRVKGLILTPQKEWERIEAEDTTIAELYRSYIAVLAAIPPFASFLGAWLFGSRGLHPTFLAGLFRAIVEYLLSFPALFAVAFVISMAAPHFDGKTDDRRALTLAAYSYTPAWLAAIFGLVPGLRFLDVLGFYGIYVFSLGLTRMMRIPKDNLDVFTLVALFVTIAMGALHAWIVSLIAPSQLM
ncbi:Yip1 family protein [Methylocystis parvus]|uniref:YIP1 family protein n=1 Tax=Methylocystis parvus TaxID=134 RepID=A0A6B8MBB1_9HYPH|nr:Yip1 family protein [Methylocystis parvus]QGM98889.1 YIP1 family protein [Methylocystis parvus]WBK00755.1 YIP1 family protein [Methylocystis parvus OBBP]